MTGWGSTETSPYSLALKVGEFEGMSNFQCAASLGVQLDYFGESILCAAGNESNSNANAAFCDFDIGGIVSLLMVVSLYRVPLSHKVSKM